ncbi:MAG: hypothetical protein V3T39_04410 [Gammaproteobacteria bacterium]
MLRKVYLAVLPDIQDIFTITAGKLCNLERLALNTGEKIILTAFQQFG